MRAPLILILFVLGITGCTSTKYVSQKERHELYQGYLIENQIEPVSKVTSFRFNGWRSLTDDYLTISISPKRKLLIEISGFCPDLRYANAIVLHQNMSSILVAKSDAISLADTPNIKCPIKNIYKINKEQLAQISALGKIDEQQETAE